MHPYEARHDVKGWFPSSSLAKEVRELLSTNYRSPALLNNYPYPVSQLAIYLDDFVHHSGATKIHPKSHLKYFLYSPQGIFTLINLKFNQIFFGFSRSINPDLNPGDGVFFNARTYHSGQFVRYRLFPKFSLPYYIDDIFKYIRMKSDVLVKFLEKFLIFPFVKSRKTIFLDLFYDSLIACTYQADHYFSGNMGIRAFISDDFLVDFFNKTSICVLDPLIIKKYCKYFKE